MQEAVSSSVAPCRSHNSALFLDPCLLRLLLFDRIQQIPGHGSGYGEKNDQKGRSRRPRAYGVFEQLHLDEIAWWCGNSDMEADRQWK